MPSKTNTTGSIELPDDNPVERFANPVPEEGSEGLFSQSWFPICLSEELKSGDLLGVPFLDGKVITYRGSDGVARVMSAYCPHVGSDLSIGRVVGNHVECRFHRWQYDAEGRCAKTAIGDDPPARARLFKFPSQERYGIVWAFNGNEPLFDVPDFEYPDADLLVRAYRFDEPFRCDPWVFAANTPDMQHFKVVHGIQFDAEDPHNLVDWQEWGFRYGFSAGHQDGTPIEWTVGIRGTSIFWQEGLYGDTWLGGIVGFALLEPGCHRVFAALAIRDAGPEAGTLHEELFAGAEHLMHRTINEDREILNTIHYRPGTLTRGDTTLARYLKFLRDFPRAHPSRPFLR